MYIFARLFHISTQHKSALDSRSIQEGVTLSDIASSPNQEKKINATLHRLWYGAEHEGLRSQFVKTKPLIPFKTIQKALWNF
jgi:hypothetical protein